MLRGLIEDVTTCGSFAGDGAVEEREECFSIQKGQSNQARWH